MAAAKNTAIKADGWAASIHPMLRTLILFDGNISASVMIYAVRWWC